MSNKYIHLIAKALCTALCALALGACSSQEFTRASGFGWVEFTVSTPDLDGVENYPIPQFSLTMQTADGAYSHHWSNIADFSQYETYAVGQYIAQAVSGTMGDEGYDCPCFAGTAEFEIKESTMAHVPLVCRLTQAVLDVKLGQGLLSHYPTAKATVHATGHGYVQTREQQGVIFLSPGVTYLYVTLTDEQGRSVSISPDFHITTVQGKKFDILIDMPDSGSLTVSSGNITTTMQVGADLFDKAAPTIQTEGFLSDVQMSLTEGYPAANPVKMLVDAPAGLTHVWLTSVGLEDEIPAECDLLSQAAAVCDHGLVITREGEDKLSIDFTKMLASLGVSVNSEFTFLVQARDKLNRVSAPSILRVKIQSVDLQPTEIAPAIVGEDIATITLHLNSPDFVQSDFEIFILDDEGEEVSKAAITAFKPNAQERTAEISFNVGEGLETVPVRIDFMGNPKLKVNVTRFVPEYKIFVDAFSMYAEVYVTTENEALRRIVTEKTHVTVNGANAMVIERNARDGVISVSQLQPNTSYTISSILIPGQYIPEVRVTTEKAEQLPNGDFEDFADGFRYSDLPSGGLYSNTVFPIFNMQNYESYDVKWPQKHWASTNEKTFCKSAIRHNTWYMQPSALLDFNLSASGSKSLMLQSVGWSLNGPEIEPYVQDGETQLQYNANVPEVAHRSSGRAFLGSYKFNPATQTEVYTEGISFGSRPRSLNGFYQYVSDPNSPDYGLVLIELINDQGDQPVQVATAGMRFPASTGFVAFNLPLEYRTIGVKATKLKLMFFSSYLHGTIEQEDMLVPTTANAEQGRYIGSVLHIDNLSLSY